MSEKKFHHRHCDYLGQVFTDVNVFEKTIREICKALRKAEKQGKIFTHIAVSGVSGCVVGSAVALRLKKNLIVIRKDNDGSHSFTKVEGYPDESFQYIILDDFVSSGYTISQIYRKINMCCEDSAYFCGVYQYLTGYKSWYSNSETLSWERKQ